MAGFSDYGENFALDAVFGSGTIPTLYLALYTAAPTDAGGGTEVSGGSYARKSITNNPATARATRNHPQTHKIPLLSNEVLN